MCSVYLIFSQIESYRCMRMPIFNVTFSFFTSFNAHSIHFEILFQNFEYDIETMLEPKSASELMYAARQINHNIALYLPRNSKTDQVSFSYFKRGNPATMFVFRCYLQICLFWTNYDGLVFWNQLWHTSITNTNEIPYLVCALAVVP